MRKLFVLAFLFCCTCAGTPLLAQTPLTPRDSTINGPQTFALIMGISKYKYVRPLQYADKDAELFKEYLQSPGGGSVSKDNIYCLLNEKANNHNFWSKGFQWLKAKDLQKGDRLFIYLAGHGDAIDEDQFFFLGYDCNPGGDKNNYLVSGAIQLFNLKKKIIAETAKGVEVFFIMDACRSDELPGGAPGQNFLNSAITEKKAGEIIMLATGAGQESLEDASIGNGHGLFTYFLVDGLNGMADSLNDNRISFDEIQRYVKKNVPSIAQQRFNHKQEPFFCCNENGDKIISIVDTAYLKNWMKKRMPVKGTGNSFNGTFDRSPRTRADTTLLQAYDRFNRAINANQLSGNASASYYYDFMNRQFPGTPYTLDAKTTLAAEYIGYAQDRINQYLNCGDDLSANERQLNGVAAARLQEAIGLLSDEEPEFANSLLARMYFLQSGANHTNTAAAFQSAYACMAIDRNAAYICNRLANLHLNADNRDSAVFYARKAMAIAPLWRCSYTTLSKAYDRLNQPDSASQYKERAKANDPSRPLPGATKTKSASPRKMQWGVTTSYGSTQLQATNSNWERGNINYRDSLNRITSRKKNKVEFGIVAQLNFTDKVAVRPSVLLSFEKMEILYDKKPSITSPPRIDTIRIETSGLNLSWPLIFKLSTGKIAPYVVAGPTINFLLQQNEPSATQLPLKSIDLLADAGLGFDIGLGKIIISPEVKYTMGLNNIRKNASNLYTNTLSSLKRQAFSASIVIRKN